MSESLFTQLLDLACGAFLLAAVVVLWRRELAAIVRLFALQGLALAAIALLLGLHEERWDLIVVAVGIGALRAGLLPYLIRRALATLVADREQGPAQPWARSEEVRETQPLVLALGKRPCRRVQAIFHLIPQRRPLQRVGREIERPAL